MEIYALPLLGTPLSTVLIKEGINNPQVVINL